MLRRFSVPVRAALLVVCLATPVLADPTVVTSAHVVDTHDPAAAAGRPSIDGGFSDVICHVAMLRVRNVEELVLAMWICRFARIFDGDDA